MFSPLAVTWTDCPCGRRDFCVLVNDKDVKHVLEEVRSVHRVEDHAWRSEDHRLVIATFTNFHRGANRVTRYSMHSMCGSPQSMSPRLVHIRDVRLLLSLRFLAFLLLVLLLVLALLPCS